MCVTCPLYSYTSPGLVVSILPPCGNHFFGLRSALCGRPANLRDTGLGFLVCVDQEVTQELCLEFRAVSKYQSESGRLVSTVLRGCQVWKKEKREGESRGGEQEERKGKGRREEGGNFHHLCRKVNDD
jgi:hypothetical protein